MPGSTSAHGGRNVLVLGPQEHIRLSAVVNDSGNAGQSCNSPLHFDGNPTSIAKQSMVSATTTYIGRPSSPTARASGFNPDASQPSSSRATRDACSARVQNILEHCSDKGFSSPVCKQVATGPHATSTNKTLRDGRSIVFSVTNGLWSCTYPCKGYLWLFVTHFHIWKYHILYSGRLQICDQQCMGYCRPDTK